MAIPVRYDLYEPVTGPLADVAQLDPAGTACQPLPPESLAGRVALVAYSGCRFEQKLINAQEAGAELRTLLEADPTLEVTLKFTLAATAVSPNRVAFFSSRGPSAGETIKPDLLAAGMQLLIATQGWDPRGGMCAPSGYAAAQGTSFAAPLVAGAAAALKAARPGLTVEQYRSLLANSAAPLLEEGDKTAPVQQAGAGLLNLDAALRSTLTAWPVSLSFGADHASEELSTELLVTNLGSAGALLEFSAVAEDGDAEIRVPYWHAVGSASPRHITVLKPASQGAPGSAHQLWIRVTDPAGIALPWEEPRAAALSGGGAVLGVTSLDSEYPGVWSVEVQLGDEAGSNVFEIEAGGARKEVIIEARAP